ncbi:MAG: Ig domain-containing protein [Defluviitaleaceae bacterium]|nr:Ig domain-containing protein [Defluviitaleaceae bacterium]MCL2262253.1 Ig domain-containing protein [Defluviitaleaceae bacterium]
MYKNFKRVLCVLMVFVLAAGVLPVTANDFRITTTEIPPAIVGEWFEFQMEYEGDPGSSRMWFVNGPQAWGWMLPAGLSICSDLGIISGTPTQVTDGTQVMTVGVETSWGKYMVDLVFQVLPQSAGGAEELRDELLRHLAHAEELAVTTFVSEDGSDVPVNIYWVTTVIINDFWIAINAAQEVLNEVGAFDAASDITVLENAIATLEAAVGVFIAARQPGRYAPALQITTAEIPPAIVGEWFSYTLGHANAQGDVTWRITGSLPFGLTFSSDGTISGVPIAAGEVWPSFHVSDNRNQNLTRAMSVRVLAAGGIADLPPFTIQLVGSYIGDGQGVVAIYLYSEDDSDFQGLSWVSFDMQHCSDTISFDDFTILQGEGYIHTPNLGSPCFLSGWFDALDTTPIHEGAVARVYFTVSDWVQVGHVVGNFNFTILEIMDANGNCCCTGILDVANVCVENAAFTVGQQNGGDPLPVITGVTITRHSATVAHGETAVFYAEVHGNYLYCMDTHGLVNWAATAGNMFGGFLTVPATVSAGTVITVTATSVFDPTVSATATITVVAPPVSVPPIEPMPDGPAISVATVFARPSETVNVTVRLDRNPGFAAMMLQVDLPDYATLISYNVPNTVLQNTGLVRPRNGADFVEPNTPTSITGTFHMGWLLAENFTADTTLLVLTLEICSDAPLELLPINISFASAMGVSPPINADHEPLEIYIRQGGVHSRIEFVRGNASGNGVLGLHDGLTIARYIVGHAVTIDHTAADLNGDERVDLEDLMIFMGWLVGYGSPND